MPPPPVPHLKHASSSSDVVAVVGASSFSFSPATSSAVRESSREIGGKLDEWAVSLGGALASDPQVCVCVCVCVRVFFSLVPAPELTG